MIMKARLRGYLKTIRWETSSDCQYSSGTKLVWTRRQLTRRKITEKSTMLTPKKPVTIMTLQSEREREMEEGRRCWEREMEDLGRHQERQREILSISQQSHVNVRTLPLRLTPNSETFRHDYSHSSIFTASISPPAISVTFSKPDIIAILTE